ncbi:MAG: phosphodiester glycosidase family protein [Chloroflexota bacterium]
MKPKRRSRLLIGASVLLVLFATAFVLYYRGRPMPIPARETLRQGVEYERMVRVSPRPMVVHVVTINLNTKKLRFLVTPPDNPKTATPLNARTASEFLEEFDLDIAVNGDGFSPWWSRTPADYYPHSGDPVAPRGDAASEGLVYWRTPDPLPTLYISSKNKVSFDAPATLYNAISGVTMLVKNGAALEGLNDTDIHPRTAIGYSENGKFLYIVVVDGRQPLYSEGMKLTELAQLMLDLGAHNAMSLDGGGSSTLVVRGADGQPRVLNSPVDLYIPGRERPIANHLGIYFKK